MSKKKGGGFSFSEFDGKSVAKAFESIQKIKSELLKSGTCKTSFKDFSGDSVFKSRDNFYKSFFLPLVDSSCAELRTFKSKQKREAYIKERFSKATDVQKGMVDYIVNWYWMDSVDLIKKYGENWEYKKFRDFVYFRDILQRTKVPIKLILTQTSGKTSKYEKFYANFKTEYGATHAALQIGPYIIDWNKGEVIVPRPLRVSDPIMVLDLPSKSPCSTEFWKSVSDVIWEWNCGFRYDLLTKKMTAMVKEKKGNCHGFVKYFVRVMKEKGFPIKLHFYEMNGPIHRHLNYLKRWDKKNRSSKLYSTDKKGSKRKYYLSDFKSHKDLHTQMDKFLGKKISEIDPHQPKDLEKLKLLKAIDKAFWYSKKRGAKDDWERKNCPLLHPQVPVSNIFIVCRGEEVANANLKKKYIETEKKIMAMEKEYGGEIFDQCMDYVNLADCDWKDQIEGDKKK